MHHDAQTFTSVTASLKSAAWIPGNGLPSRASRPGTGGMLVSGAGCPISAEGMREGSPEPSRKKNSAASARKDRKSTRLNSSHANISYAVFCLKKKKNN